MSIFSSVVLSDEGLCGKSLKKLKLFKLNLKETNQQIKA